MPTTPTDPHKQVIGHAQAMVHSQSTQLVLHLSIIQDKPVLGEGVPLLGEVCHIHTSGHCFSKDLWSQQSGEKGKHSVSSL